MSSFIPGCRPGPRYFGYVDFSIVERLLKLRLVVDTKLDWTRNGTPAIRFETQSTDGLNEDLDLAPYRKRLLRHIPEYPRMRDRPSSEDDVERTVSCILAQLRHNARLNLDANEALKKLRTCVTKFRRDMAKAKASHVASSKRRTVKSYDEVLADRFSKLVASLREPQIAHYLPSDTISRLQFLCFEEGDGNEDARSELDRQIANLPHPRGRKQVVEKVMHALILHFCRRCYTANDGDFGDDETLAARASFKDNDFDPRTAASRRHMIDKQNLVLI